MSARLRGRLHSLAIVRQVAVVGESVETRARTTKITCTRWQECVTTRYVDRLCLSVEAEFAFVVLLGPFLIMSRSTWHAHEWIR